MGKKTKVLIILFVFTTLLTGIVNGTEVEINPLIEESIDFDNKEVIIQGEAIGEALERGQYAWVNINDGTNTIGVWLTIEDANKISFFGDYKHKGDIVKVTGTFHSDCKEHGGDVDIHNTNFSVLEKGYTVNPAVGSLKIVILIILLFVTLMVSFVYYKVTRKTMNA